MSYLDIIQETSRLLTEMLDLCENETFTSKPPNSEDAEVDVSKSSDHVPVSTNETGNLDDKVSASEAIDPNNQVPDAPSHPRPEIEDKADIFSLDIPKSTCGRSDSEASGDSFDSESWYRFLEEDTFYGIYAFYITQYRKKGYLLPFEIICLAFAVTCCYIGAYNWSMCPADDYIPRYVFFNGAVATFSLIMKIVDTLWIACLPRQYDGDVKYYCAFGVGWVALITTLIEMTDFYTMPYSFYRNDENYCNAKFYWFVYYKNIALGVIMFLTAIIYIPSYDETRFLGL